MRPCACQRHRYQVPPLLFCPPLLLYHVSISGCFEHTHGGMLGARTRAFSAYGNARRYCALALPASIYPLIAAAPPRSWMRWHFLRYLIMIFFDTSLLLARRLLARAPSSFSQQLGWERCARQNTPGTEDKPQLARRRALCKLKNHLVRIMSHGA